MIRLRLFKRMLSCLFCIPFAFQFCLLLQRLLYGVAYVRIINYHGTPARHQKQLEAQLQFFSRYYSNVSIDELDRLVTDGAWKKERPGLMLTFDDGLRSHYEYALPLLEKYGFSGCFMIPSSLVAGQPESVALPSYSTRVHADEKWSDSRHMISIEELRQIRPPHLVVSHTVSHARMKPSLSERAIHHEIFNSRKKLEELTGHAITSFCWVGGEPSNYHPIAMRKIQEAGYRYSFMTCSGMITAKTHPLQLHRTNIEANASVTFAMLQVSGLMDCYHWDRRRRVNRLTGAELRNTL